MKSFCLSVFSGVFLFSAQGVYAGEATHLPAKLRQTLERALATQDSFIIEATFAAAHAKYPADIADIEALRPEEITHSEAAQVIEPSRKPLPLEVKPQKEEGLAKWKGDVSASFNKASGNTDTENILSSIDLEREKEHWRHKFAGQIRFASQDGERINEDYRVRLGSDWKFSEKLFLFGEAEYVADEFSGFDYRISESVGLGSRWKWSGSERYLDLRASVGARHLKSTAFGAQAEHNAIFRPEADFNWQVRDGLIFKQTARSTVGTDVTTTEAETSFKYKLNSKLDLKLSFQLEHTSSVPAGTKKWETYTATGLTYHLFD